MRVKSKDFLYLTLIYIVSLFLYAYIARNMTLPTYRWVDEDLHIALAKSFHFNHNFWRNYQPVGENSVLYSIFLSVAYFLYTPENIVSIMRFISLAAMCTVVCPVYLLAKQILNRKSWIWCITVFSVFIPEMFYGMYILQETLAYPLVIWTIYLLYRKFDRENWTPGDMIIPVFLAIVFCTKTCLIVMAIAYYITELTIWTYNVRHKKINPPHTLRNICISAAFFVCLVILSQIMIWALNGFQSGVSHYAAQISRIFPISAETIKRVAGGCAFYLVFVMLTYGILPILVPFSCIKNMEKKDILLSVFLIAGIILTALEVVITIVLPEELPGSYITRVYIRYFFYYFLPLLMLLLKYQRTCELNWKVVTGLFLFLCVGLYFMSQSYKLMPLYTDSVLWFWLHIVINRLPKFGVAILLGEVMLSVIFIVWKGTKKSLLQCLMAWGGAAIIFMCNCGVINATGAANKATQEEIIKIAQDTRQCECIYLASTNLTNSVMALSDYIDQDIRVIILLYGYTYEIVANSAIVIPNDLLAEYQLGQGDVDIVEYGQFSVLYNGGSLTADQQEAVKIISTRTE